jgi:hypothetical protein
MAKLKVQADRVTEKEIQRWMESIGPANQQELAEIIDAADDRWSKLEWARISDWIERNGGRRSYANWLVLEGAELKPKPLPPSKHPLDALEGRLWSTPRSRRLFACACCRRIWDMLPDTAHRALEASERYADGLLKQKELLALLPEHVPLTWENERFGRAMLAVRWATGPSSNQTKRSFLADMTGCTNMAKAGVNRNGIRVQLDEAESAAQADLVRCIFGTPYYPVPISENNLTNTVISLARAAYEERHLPSGELDSFRLSILADALEEAGATQEVLIHLRGSWPHVRGCWVIDALMGRQ